MTVDPDTVLGYAVYRLDRGFEKDLVALLTDRQQAAEAIHGVPDRKLVPVTAADFSDVLAAWLDVEKPMSLPQPMSLPPRVPSPPNPLMVSPVMVDSPRPVDDSLVAGYALLRRTHETRLDVLFVTTNYETAVAEIRGAPNLYVLPVFLHPSSPETDDRPAIDRR